MAKDRFSLLDWLRKTGMDKDCDFLRESVQMLAQALIDLEAADRIGAGAWTVGRKQERGIEVMR